MPIDPKLDWWFSRQCDRARDMDDLRDLLKVEFERLGFRYFALCSHVNPARPPKGAVLVHNYPAVWVSHHFANNYARRDPVFFRAREQTLSFLWCDLAFLAGLEPDQIRILEEAAAHGLKHGATIPIHGPHRYSASCSLVSDAPIPDLETVLKAEPLARYAYETARRIAGAAEPLASIRLAKRERQCLQLVAIGKDDDTIALILGIEPATVRNHVDNAKLKLGVTRRTHAVALAIHVGAINLEEIFFT